MKAILYLRYSPRPEEASIITESVEHQREKCVQFCRLSGHDVVAEYVDREASGSSMQGRPGLEDALKHVCRTGGVLVVASMSRLARNLMDALVISKRLQDGGSHLAVVEMMIDTSTVMGRFFFQIMASLAELERETTAERTRVAVRRRQANGQMVSSRPPYGYRVKGDRTVGVTRSGKTITRKVVEPDPKEFGAIEAILERDREGLSAHAIAQWLNMSEWPPRGREWTHHIVKRIIRREADKGAA